MHKYFSFILLTLIKLVCNLNNGRIANKDFEILDISDQRYLECRVDAMAYLKAESLVHA